MRVLFSYWGFCESFEDCNEPNTPDGSRFTRPMFVNALTIAGHQVTSLQKRREKNEYPGITYDPVGLPDGDILFIEWRWKTWKNFGDTKFENDYDRQIELLQHYHGEVPVVIWDCDMKLTSEDENRWPEAIIADPTMDPKQLTRKRARLPFSSDLKFLVEPYEDPVRYGYIGNNYERDEMFEKYYNCPAKSLRPEGIQTSVFGNWLLRSPERMSPEHVTKKFRNIAFIDRVGFTESMQQLRKFICTTHITKPEYAKRGFVSPRYLENIATCTPSLVPCEFMMNNILGNNWMASSSGSVVKAVRYLRCLLPEDRAAVVDEQRYNLRNNLNVDVKQTVEFLEGLIK